MRLPAVVLAMACTCASADPIPAQGWVKVAFSPTDDAEQMLVDALGTARTTIRVQAFLITSRTVAAALIAARERGVDVSLVADLQQFLRGGISQLPRLADAGIRVRLDGQHAAAHDKIVLIDAESNRPVVITGSFNFTYSAQHRNAENLLMLGGNPTLAANYLANWRAHDAHSLDYRAVLQQEAGRLRHEAKSSGR